MLKVTFLPETSKRVRVSVVNTHAPVTTKSLCSSAPVTAAESSHAFVMAFVRLPGIVSHYWTLQSSGVNPSSHRGRHRAIEAAIEPSSHRGLILITHCHTAVPSRLGSLKTFATSRPCVNTFASSLPCVTPRKALATTDQG